MKIRTIKQSVTFKVPAHEVYEALMDAKKHSAFTDSKCKISRKVGGKFSIYDGDLSGVNLELEEDKKIVQSWRANDWPEGHYSQATFLLSGDDSSTNLAFTQTGVPELYYEDIYQGWYDYYWNPMKDMLEKKKRKT